MSTMSSDASPTSFGGTGGGFDADDVASSEPTESQGELDLSGDMTIVAKATAMYDYEPEEGDDDEVPMTAGEVVDVINSDNSDWWLIRTSKGETGLVPANYLETE